MGKTGLFTLMVISLFAGYMWSYQVNKMTPTKIYEDGSYYGCLKDYPCND